jgi:hypothetical protein
MSLCKKPGKNYSKEIANRSFEVPKKFKCFGTTLPDKNCMNEEIKSRFNSGNAY